MAQRNYLVEGLSGAGKSSVYEELIRRGHWAVSTDRAWKTHDSMWDERRAVGELESPEPEVLFVCGSSRNRDRFLRYFTRVFNLRIDDDTMRRRLRERTNNDTGKQPGELELILALNRNGEKPAGAIDVDATRPLDDVVDDVLRLARCAPVAGDSTRPPWSRRGPATAHALVVSESGETVARIDFGWSGDVLVTLLAYLDEQGIDLAHSDLLTPDHRARHLALLDPIEFDGAVLRRYYEARNETTAPRVDYAMLDGIAFLRDTLAPLESPNVAVLVLGPDSLRA